MASSNAATRVGMSLVRLKATDAGARIADERVTLQVTFGLTPAEAHALDEMPGNVAVNVKRIVQAHLAREGKG